MTADPATVDPALLDAAFEASLTADANRGALAAEPPPRPHWLNDDGSAKYGTKPDGTPKKGPGGPGRGKQGATRPRGDTKTGDTPGVSPPHTAGPGASPGTPPEDPPGAGPAGHDYAADVEGLLFMVWMGCASTPWTKPQAAIVKNATPQLAPAWGKAAEQNATIRRWVDKLASEGSWAWLIPVAMTTTPFALGLWSTLTDRELRRELAAQTEQDWTQFIRETAAANGIQLPEAAPDPATPADLADQAAELATAAAEAARMQADPAL